MTGRIGGPPDPRRRDGRQSTRARDIARGAVRLLKLHDMECFPELPLPNHRRVDLIALGPKNEIWILEIKSSLTDYRVDQKWAAYCDYCDQFYFAIAADFDRDVLPDDIGVIVADRFGGEILKPAPLHSLGAARRKLVTLCIARAAAARLQAILDPDAALEPRRGN